MSAISVKDILTKKPIGETCLAQGWIKSIRKKKSFSFVVLNDGSTFQDLQIIMDASVNDYEEASTLLIGSSVSFKGLIVESGGKGQSVEMQAKEVKIYSKTDDTYPLQKKETSLEYLREIAHLRGRTNTFAAVMRIRNTLAYETHRFFQDRGYFYLHTPVITGVDAEGAGEMFRVSLFEPTKAPLKAGKVDYTQDYFGKETSLTVSGQLEAECYALALGKVYTFGPTFRAENSNTARHLAEFWMIEPEVAFADLDFVAKLGADYIQHLIKSAFSQCADDLDFLSKREDATPNHLDVLKLVANTDFKMISYTEAVEILQKSNEKFEYPTNWGNELQTEHERFLTEKHFKAPLIVTDYPKHCKAFYMKQNDDGKTVRCMDILVPGVGEIIGGSQREDNLEKLRNRVHELKMNEEALWWYMDLRRFGSVPHAGFGLGFERAVMYITGMKNIRDVIPFPRTPKSAEF